MFYHNQRSVNMAVSANVTRKLDNNYVQVDVTSKKTDPRYYKVPESKADQFCKDFTKTDKRMSIISDTSFVVSTLIGCAILSLVTRKLSGIARIVLGILGGLSLGFASEMISANTMVKKYQQLLKTYQAEEIKFEDKQKQLNEIL